ncbi:hypothetical protein POSPLADRAFT_1047061 [Postia placenta MAD-698-R-SB12]|uniref:Uncharacterized protein n=1 Tax=Postia placenta MAD-698-R-SB12 TaxID=670580 RepID=A0A1X6MZL2_9APHY|nr:hypothetical protein POSPLADRAFT_1047061 [Postia placenta MAD-698-R-SB12]OSX61804.1 hypothetical protein POSPLADRAFT_1047061 [Postia placenta MAD-698-R-SB12]
MCTTPPVFLTWAVLSTLLGTFLLFHLWKFDRFKCLRWNNGPYSGAFKRVMTYTYLLSIPLIMAYSIGFCVIMYKLGYMKMPGYGLMPLPFALWPPHYYRAIFPLNMLFSIAWALEMITHLEELCFWLFLVNAGSVQQDWFRSLYFKSWIAGSVLAIYMPIVTIVTRSDPAKSVAATFLAGSLGDLSLTLWFLPVLFMFPSFLRSLKSEGVDISTIVRLTTFHELNCIRVVFRFFFCAPFLILGVDGITSRLLVNTNLFASEFLAFLAAIGCMVSSGITLVIFFPRSIETEVRARNASRDKSHLHTFPSERDSCGAPPPEPKGSAPPYTATVSLTKLAPYGDAPEEEDKARPLDIEAPGVPPLTATAKKMFAPNRRLDSGATVEGRVQTVGLTEHNLARHNFQSSSVHPFVHNFTSPIDLMQAETYQGVTRYNARRYA